MSQKSESHMNAVVYEIAFLCLRSPFGTTPAPSEYMTISEAAIDLGNIYSGENLGTQII